MKRSQAVVVGVREEALEGEEHHEDLRDDGRAGEQQTLVALVLPVGEEREADGQRFVVAVRGLGRAELVCDVVGERVQTHGSGRDAAHLEHGVELDLGVCGTWTGNVCPREAQGR